MRISVQNNAHKKTTAPRRHRQRTHHFLAAWLRSPMKVGAVMPSSRALSRAMAAQVDLAVPGTVIELGAGTGVVTNALLQAHVPPERLLVIERDQRLHAGLAAQFPQLRVLCADAAELDGVLKEQKILGNPSPRRGEVRRGAQNDIAEQEGPHPNPPPMGEGIMEVSAIVSSLPLLSIPEPVRGRIIHHMATLTEKGVIVQFTYGPRSPISPALMRQYGLHGKRVKLVVGNVPPAHVWVYRRN